MIEWIDVANSSRVVAVAYDVEAERILVRFPDGTEWQYEGCPSTVWAEFEQCSSKGQFISTDLNRHPNRRLVD